MRTPSPEAHDLSSTAPGLEIVAEPLGGYERLAGTIGRTLWDLEDYDGLVFLGYGDGTANTGPTDILAYDPRTRAHRVETTVDEEAVTTFRLLGEHLYVPGPDPVGSPDDGALFVRKDGSWTKVVVPKAVHVFDVMVWKERLFVALQERPNRAVVLESSNGGITWRRHRVPGWRAKALLTVDDQLLVSSFGGGLAALQGDAFAFVPSPLRAEAPPIGDDAVDTEAEDAVVMKAARCGGATWTLLAWGSVAYGYGTSTLSSIRREGPRLETTDDWLGGRPDDLFVWDGRCHVVTNDRATEPITIRIHRADQGGWTQVAETHAYAIARSAIRVGDHYYLGLGCDAGGCGADAGKLARLPVTAVD